MDKLAKEASSKTISGLFDTDPDRFESCHISHNGLCFDYSRTLTTDDIRDHLFGLAEDQRLSEWRDKMFSGEKINLFEDRAVLHTALRAPANANIQVDGQNVMPEIHRVLDQMRDFCDGIHDGTITGAGNQTITDIVNIGIGGSYLGPEMAYTALSYHHIPGIRVHFAANVDGHDIHKTLEGLDPERTLFLVASKTFTTQETMANAATAKQWIINALGRNAVKDHFIALSTNTEKAGEFGISPERVFPFRDWVGGRFSLWSAIGMSVALGVGFKKFRQVLDGAHDMDTHFRNAPMNQNIPVVLALLGIWHRNFLNAGSLAVLPYDQRLKHFPAYLQQLDMESNGKSVDRNNDRVEYPTGPVVFGEPGTNGQHAFYQLIHQGTDLVPCEFIGFKNADHPFSSQHEILLSHMIAQATALMQGRSLKDANDDPQKVFEGNKPSAILLFESLTPFSLGQLIALYEHKIFCQGIIWNLNSFDQWGVELGKVIARDILKRLTDEFDGPCPQSLSILKQLK